MDGRVLNHCDLLRSLGAVNLGHHWLCIGWLACSEPSYYLNQCWLIISYIIHREYTSLTFESNIESKKSKCIWNLIFKWQPFLSGLKLLTVPQTLTILRPPGKYDPFQYVQIISDKFVLARSIFDITIGNVKPIIHIPHLPQDQLCVNQFTRIIIPSAISHVRSTFLYKGIMCRYRVCVEVIGFFCVDVFPVCSVQ